MNLSDLKKMEDIDNMYLCFKRKDGVDAFYKIISDGTLVYIDEATIARWITCDSATDFAGFGKSQNLTFDVFSLVARPGDTTQNPVNNVPQNSGMKQLLIQGIDPEHPRKAIADISRFFIGGSDLQVKSEDKLEIQACTHTITIGEDVVSTKLRGMVQYLIEEIESGRILVGVEQTGTTVQGIFGGQYGNNHPSKTYLHNLTEDSTIYTEIKDLRIRVKNKGNLPIDCWIMFPDTEEGEPERRILRTVIPVQNPGEDNEHVIDLNASDLNLKSLSFPKRAIKINFNTVPLKEI